jgi:hypothetical protein
MAAKSNQWARRQWQVGPSKVTRSGLSATSLTSGTKVRGSKPFGHYNFPKRGGR